MNVVEYKNVYKRYKNFEFANNSFCIKENRIVGLIGENGAGKTTLINLLLNKVRRDSGEIYVFEEELLKNEIGIKRNIGIVLDQTCLPSLFNVREIERFISKIYNNWDKKTFYNYICQFNLPMDKNIGQFSRGMKRKLDIAIALSHSAALLVLDEPTSGLDIISRKMILEILKEQAGEHNKTILFSSHSVSDLDSFVDDIIILNKGSIVLNDTKENIKRNYFIIENSDRESEKIQTKLEVENMIFENGKTLILVNKNEIDKCKDDFRDISRAATLEDIIYMKIKEKKNVGVNH